MSALSWKRLHQSTPPPPTPPKGTESCNCVTSLVHGVTHFDDGEQAVRGRDGDQPRSEAVPSERGRSRQARSFPTSEVVPSERGRSRRARPFPPSQARGWPDTSCGSRARGWRSPSPSSFRLVSHSFSCSDRALPRALPRSDCLQLTNGCGASSPCAATHLVTSDYQKTSLQREQFLSSQSVPKTVIRAQRRGEGCSVPRRSPSRLHSSTSSIKTTIEQPPEPAQLPVHCSVDCCSSWASVMRRCSDRTHAIIHPPSVTSFWGSAPHFLCPAGADRNDGAMISTPTSANGAIFPTTTASTWGTERGNPLADEREPEAFED